MKSRTIALTLSTGVAAALMSLVPTAQAAPVDNNALSNQFAQQLGTRSAGSYVDASTGKLVVTVTDSAAAQTVRAAGAVAKTVTRSGADLAKVTTALNKSARVPGSAWSVDVATNQVLITVDQTVTGAKLAKIQSVAGKFGDAARIERMSGTLSTNIAGGEAIYAGGSRCSLGFNVRNSSGVYYFVTAGHCTNIATTWYAAGSVLLGTRTGTSFPGNDYGIVKYTNTSVAHPGTVYLYSGSQDITSATTPAVGAYVRRSGSTTGVKSGNVQALNATVTYPQGTVYGLIKTNVCAEPGDSGGSLFNGTSAYGLTSGGSGNCTYGGTTYFQPVTEPLSVYGVSVF